MAQQNWADLMNDPDTLARMRYLASIGPQFPAAMAAPSAQIPIGTSPTSSSPMDMNAAGAAAGARQMFNQIGDIGNKRGAFAKGEVDNSRKYVHSSNRFFSRSPEDIRADQLIAQGVYPKVSDYQPLTDGQGNPVNDEQGQPVLDKDRPIYDFSQLSTDPTHPVQQQIQGVNRLQDLLKMQADANMKRSTMDWRPLAALADARAAETGRESHLEAAAQAPENPTQALMAYADEIQKRRGDIQKSITENVRNMKGGSSMDALTQMLMAKEAAGQNNAIRDPMALADANRAFRTHQYVLNKLDTDKTLQGQLQGYFGLDNALATVNKTTHLTPNGLVEAQRTIMAAMSTARGGTSGVDERAQMYLDTLPINVGDRLSQWLSGKPVNIDKTDPIVAHIKQLAQIEQQNIKENFVQHLDTFAPGASWMYSQPAYSGEDPAHNYKQSLIDKYNAMLGQFQKTGQTAAPMSAADVTPGARTAIMSPKTRTKVQAPTIAPDVAAYAKKNGITVQQAQAIKAARLGAQ